MTKIFINSCLDRVLNPGPLALLADDLSTMLPCPTFALKCLLFKPEPDQLVVVGNAGSEEHLELDVHGEVIYSMLRPFYKFLGLGQRYEGIQVKYSNHLNIKHLKSKHLTFQTLFCLVFKLSDHMIRWAILNIKQTFFIWFSDHYLNTRLCI